MLVDTHCHLQFPEYDTDRQELLAQAETLGLKMIVVGTDINSSQQAIALASSQTNVFATIGIHPTEITADWQEQLKTLETIKLTDRVVAVGEVGLDYFRLQPDSINESKAYQQAALKVFISFASSKGLPVIFHVRGSVATPEDAYQDLLTIIDSNECIGVVHCFSGSVEIAQQFVSRGFYLGITGIVTFGAKAEVLEEVVKTIPLEKLLIETDAPYLTPVPYRGKRNEPSYVQFVANRISELKNISVEEVANVTTANAQQLFKLS